MHRRHPKPHIISVVGARPQFIKVQPVAKALESYADHRVIHTGQHYDVKMSDVFFLQLAIPKPFRNLNIGSGRHGEQTGKMLTELEKEFIRHRPDLIIVYGDTNSTLAAALASAKLRIPLAHIEAGMRSYNNDMPEEVNRVLTDHLASLHFCASRQAVENLKREGITSGIFFVGDVMLDVLRHELPAAQTKSTVLQQIGLKPHQYFLCTIHRAGNTDDRTVLRNILRGLHRSPLPIVLPVHPRLAKVLRHPSLRRLTASPLVLVPPANYHDMLRLEQSAKAIITDSGGVQKEAYFLNVPCITLRNETEWVETVAAGWNRLVGHNVKKIAAALLHPPRSARHPAVYGHGRAAIHVARIIRAFSNART